MGWAGGKGFAPAWSEWLVPRVPGPIQTGKSLPSTPTPGPWPWAGPQLGACFPFCAGDDRSLWGEDRLARITCPLSLRLWP